MSELKTLVFQKVFRCQMSELISPIDLLPLPPKFQPISENIVVGKDILDLLAGSMYVDPLNIYREYIQNAADAIDEARDKGLTFPHQPDVLISLNHVERVIKIRDCGVSISTDNFVSRITSIGASQKRGKLLRGFRGVGRLSGLGYCQELIFRGRAEGDKSITEVRWDGRKLREKMRDQNFCGGLAEIVLSAVTVQTISGIGFPDRFFEVELRKISRLRNDILLNEDMVRSYLSQVAPVPFSDNFQFGEDIQKHLEMHGIRPPIRIEIDDGMGQIFHRAQNIIPLTDTVSDQVKSVEFVEYQGSDGEICAVGWIIDHSYAGSIPKRHGLGGIRLRAGNIQIGNESILADFFPEPRFTGWAIGDIHVISPKILPNGRRDEFEPSTHYAHLQSELILQAKRITQQIRGRSALRNRTRSIQLQLNTAQAWINAAIENPLPPILINAIREVAELKLAQAVSDTARFMNESEDHILTTARISELEIALAQLHTHVEFFEAPVNFKNSLERPLAAAAKAILCSAKTPKAGIDLSVEVLKAIENSLPLH